MNGLAEMSHNRGDIFLKLMHLFLDCHSAAFYTNASACFDTAAFSMNIYRSRRASKLFGVAKLQFIL